MRARSIPPLYHQGRRLKTDPAHFGLLRSSSDIEHDGEALRARLDEEGYLYLPGALDASKVRDARRVVLERLDAEGLLEPGHPLMDGVARVGKVFSFRPDLAACNQAIHTLLYTGEMMAVFRSVLGGPVDHFDFTWLRAKAPGPNTATHPHCDIVYMSRGTDQLFTAWTPLGDVPFELGGLMVLEGSHRREDLLGDYWEFDVDTYCEDGDDDEAHTQWSWPSSGGSYAPDAFAARDRVGGRWLTHEYRAGDLLIFNMFLLHSSLDNQTERIRISTDSRYQLAGQPIDERWIGEEPIAHGDEAKVGMIC